MANPIAEHPWRAALLAASAVAVVAFGIGQAHPPGDPPQVKDILFVLAVFGVPYLVFAFIVWTARWEWRPGARPRLAMLGAAAGGASAAMLLLLLPLWSVLVGRDALAAGWVIGGVALGLAATVCGIGGAPKLRRPALASVLLLPFWFFAAVLLLKASLD